MQLEQGYEYECNINNSYIKNDHVLEIKQINKNICNCIKQYFEFNSEDTILQEIQPEKCFYYLVPIIDSALNYISNHNFFLSNRISDLNNYITYLKYLKIFSNGVYDKIFDKRESEEKYYLSQISEDDSISFYDHTSIKYIKFSKINLSSKDLDTLNIILNNLMESSKIKYK